MERIDEEIVTELGIASMETRGGTVASIEPGGRLPFLAGIDDED